MYHIYVQNSSMVTSPCFEVHRSRYCWLISASIKIKTSVSGLRMITRSWAVDACRARSSNRVSASSWSQHSSEHFSNTTSPSVDALTRSHMLSVSNKLTTLHLQEKLTKSQHFSDDGKRTRSMPPCSFQLTKTSLIISPPPISDFGWEIKDGQVVVNITNLLAGRLVRD